MMDLNFINLHPEFPQKVWVIVEQPRNEPRRFSYDSASQVFSLTSHRSLIFERGFSGVYGWIGGTGVPPAPHHDVLLFTNVFPTVGEVLPGHVCRVFLRQDNDHKFVAVDDEIRRSMTTADLPSLDKVFYDELLRLYPRVDKGEGWFGAEVAIAQLLKKPFHD
jgi:inorganic pyrophosphatase